MRVGSGWSRHKKRQLLVDWHLDKIVALDQKCKVISAIENTHQKNYVSEKVFDAFALLGIPLYFSSKEHAINRVVPENSFVNVNGNLSSKYDVDDISVESYMQAQRQLFNTLSNTKLLYDERSLFVNKVMKFIS